MKERDKLLKEISEALVVQDKISIDASMKLEENIREINSLDNDFKTILDMQNKLIKQLESNNVQIYNINSDISKISQLLKEERTFNSNHISSINFDDSWDNFVNINKDYAKEHSIDLSNPYHQMFSNVQRANINKQMIDKFNICELDKYDYAFATACGIISGIIDACLVGTIKPGKDASYLQNKVDILFDNIVQKYAIQEKKANLLENKRKALIAHPENSSKINEKFDDLIKKANNMDKKQCISYLEKQHKVSYDISNHSSKVKIFDLQSKEEVSISWLSPNNHHLLSLAHEPSLLGLIIGIFDQLTNTVTLRDPINGKIRRFAINEIPDKHLPLELMRDGIKSSPNDFVKKICDASTNWFGHIMSDIAGSHSSKGRGAGLPVPGWESLQKLQFGNIPINGSNKTIAEASQWMFENGLDIRAFIAESIPVILNEILVRLYWFYKQHFYFGKSLKDSIPIANDRELSRLLLISTASFSAIDTGHAVLKGFKDGLGNFNWGTFLMTINIPGLIDFGFRATQNIRNQINQRHYLENYLDNDLQEEWNRILK